jgi:serine carboxypeptidase 1
MRSIFALVATLAALVGAAVVPDEDWGYVSVREGANMFWWLYGSQATDLPREQQPVVIWLQGGPGASSTAFGNFMEHGPVGFDGETQTTYNRKFTWVQRANVVYVDNPVGVGFSYVTNQSLIPTDNAGIASDLVELLKGFMSKYPSLETAPFYVFCESYGGKMTTGFAYALREAIARHEVTADFRGIALGDSWISAQDYVDAWPAFLYATSLLDEHQMELLQVNVTATDKAIAAGQWLEATQLWEVVEDTIEDLTDDVDFYNILIHHDNGILLSERYGAAAEAAAAQVSPSLRNLFRRHVGRYMSDPLSTFMNGPVRSKLGSTIPAGVTWGGQAGWVFETLSTDFMKPVYDQVDDLLKDGFNVTIYQGQVDLICATAGTRLWMKKLTWDGMPGFNASPRIPLYPNTSTRDTGAFYKQSENLGMYSINLAGHMVPADQPQMALTMMLRIIDRS